VLDVAIPPGWKQQWDDLVRRLHDPFALRVTVLSAVVGFGLLGVYRPMSSDITILRRDLKTAEDRLSLVREVEQLRATRAKLLAHLPPSGDINFWTEYLLGGIRDSGVVLRTLESAYRKTKVGALQGVYFDVDVAGTYEQLHALVSWIESNEYFSRIVKLRFKSEEELVECRLTLAVLVAPPATKKPKPPVKGAGAAKPSQPAAEEKPDGA
jgi:hypothetical protein